MNNQKIPRGSEFAPYLQIFLKNHSISIDELAIAMSISKYTILRLVNAESYPTDICHAEFCIMFTVVTGKSLEAYKKLNKKDKDDLVAKIVASGGSICTVGGMISLISASGLVVGLSAAGVTSGLAAIGAVVGGGMVAGVALIALAPIAVGVLLYNIVKPKNKISSSLLNFKEELDPRNELEPMN